MKKIVLFTVILLAISFRLLNAQTNQGKVIIGVSSTLSLTGTGSDLMTIGYSTIKQKSDADGYDEPDPNKRTSINFLPKVGYFIVDYLAIGIDLNIAFSTEKKGYDNSKYSRTLFSAGPFVRFYIPTSKVSPFFEIKGSFGMINNKYDYSNNSNSQDVEFKSNVMSFGGGIGLAVPLGKKVAFEVSGGYNSLTVRDKEDNDDNERTVIGTLGLKIGFSILLGSN